MKTGCRPLMFLGTGSDVGKSILAAAFCRIMAQDGYRVAPFKAQNMALNSFITLDGGEMGRAQVVQAEAAGIAPHVDMNPVLLKPTSQMGSQVIVLGKSVGNFPAADYYRYKKELVSVVKGAFDRLANQYDMIVMEGAGSAVELNLKEHDLVNMAMAEMADARCVLVGDIDRGGIFAALLGSFMLLTPREQERIAGFMVNKLRGDPQLFQNGIGILEDRGRRPVLGVIPYFSHLSIQEEDSVALCRRMKGGGNQAKPGENVLRIGVVRLPFISNYTDFDCFEHEPSVELVYFDAPSQVFGFDAVILPGSKNTLEDLDFLKHTGLFHAIIAFHRAGGTVVGVCGGYQMMGSSVRDPLGVESRLKEVGGLGLLDMETEMFPEKITSQVEARCLSQEGSIQGDVLKGYEIHMGRSRSLGEAGPLFRIHLRDGKPADLTDGLTLADGRAWGTYIHGIFDNDAFRRSFLKDIARRSGKSHVGVSESFNYHQWREEQFDLLAEHVRRHCRVEEIYEAVGLVQPCASNDNEKADEMHTGPTSSLFRRSSNSHPEIFFAMSSLSMRGLALPPEACMACPMRNPMALEAPLRKFSTAEGFSAITLSTRASSSLDWETWR